MASRRVPKSRIRGKVPTPGLASGGVPLLRSIQDALQEASTPQTKAWWENYVKGARFRGTKMADVRASLRQALDATGREREVLTNLAIDLFSQPLTEDRLAATLIIDEYLAQGAHLRTTEACMAVLARVAAVEPFPLQDWNITDWFGVKALASMVAHAQDPQRVAEAIMGWGHAPNLWQRRASHVWTVAGAANSAQELYPGFRAALLANLASSLAAAPEERFAQTGVAWVLRELTRVGGETTAQALGFLDQHLLALNKEATLSALKKVDAPTKRDVLARQAALRSSPPSPRSSSASTPAPATSPTLTPTRRKRARTSY